jgi:hypothetical protein
MLRYKKWERDLKDLPKEKRDQIMRGYQINKPSRDGHNITYRALEECTL